MKFKSLILWLIGINSFTIFSNKSFYKSKKVTFDITQQNPLVKEDDPMKMHILILEGAHLNSSLYNQPTPLLDALLKSKRDKAKFLLQYGASPHCIIDGITPIRWAINHKDYEMLIYLLRAGARIDSTDIARAKKIGDESITQLLSYTLGYRAKGKSRLCQLDKNGYAEIHYAAQTGNKPQLDALILGGVPFNLQSLDGKTATHIMAHYNQIELLTYVLQFYNVKKNIKDKFGNRPIDLAQNIRIKKILS